MKRMKYEKLRFVLKIIIWFCTDNLINFLLCDPMMSIIKYVQAFFIVSGANAGPASICSKSLKWLEGLG